MGKRGTLERKMTCMKNIRIATINLRTLQDDIKLATVIKATSKLGIDVLAIQESRRTSDGMVTFEDESIKGWQLVWSGHKRKHEHGVALLLAPHVKLKDHTEHLAARINSATINVKGVRLAILNVYSPTNTTKSEAAKSSFYAALNKAKQQLDMNPRYKVITLGDFNATISSHSKTSGAWEKILGNNNPDRIQTNDNGERMLKWCLENNMMILNSIFRTKRIHRETWRHAGTGEWKRIDYICTTPWLEKFVQSCRVHTKASLPYDTDHRLLVINISFPSTKRDLKHQISRSKISVPKPTVDYRALRDDPHVIQQLTMKVENELSTIIEDDIDMLNEQIVEVVRESVDSVCPKIDPIKKKQPWEDDTLKELTKELRNCSDHLQMRKLQKSIKKRRCKLKNEYFKHLADNINTVAEARDTEKEFAMAKKYTTLKTGSKRSISNEKLKTHFEQHFAKREIPIPPEIENPQQYPNLTDEIIPVDESPPTAEEVKKVIKNFKNNKSSGTDKMKTEGLKYNDSNNLIMAILTLMTLIWTFVKVPSVWLHCSITCLFKKGLMSLAVNYRGISIGANMSRILAKLIMDRLRMAYEAHIGKEQFGFRQNKSTSDAIFITRMIIRKCQGTLVAVYIDLTAAYDHVPRDLFKILTVRTGATHLIAILKKMYEGTTASIKGMKTNFDVLTGCRQGGQESPCIFNYFFDYVLKVAAQEIDKAFPDGWGIPFQYNISHYCTNRNQRKSGKLSGLEIIRWILYADDVVLFCRTVKDAEKILNILNDTCNRFGLTISVKKTKTQVFNNEDLAKQDTLFTIGSEKIENVQSFTYLGQVITNDTNVCFTQHRKERAIGKFYELKSVLCDTNVNLRTRRKILESCVRSRLTYGTAAWFPNEQELRKLEGCWNQCLRDMVKGGWKRRHVPEHEDGEEEADYAFFYTNEQIGNILKITPLRNFIYSQYLKYIGHICRAENTAITKILLFAKPERKYYRDPWEKISKLLGISSDQAKRMTQSRDEFAELIRKRFNSPL